MSLYFLEAVNEGILYLYDNTTVLGGNCLIFNLINSKVVGVKYRYIIADLFTDEKSLLNIFSCRIVIEDLFRRRHRYRIMTKTGLYSTAIIVNFPCDLVLDSGKTIVPVPAPKSYAYLGLRDEIILTIWSTSFASVGK